MIENTEIKEGFYDLSKIFLDPSNKRHKAVENPNLALKEMLSNEKKHKIYELAKDIVSQGNRLDPSAKLIITPDENRDDYFIVLEGNRRITALKTLINPSLASGLPRSNDFKKLSTEFMKSPIKTVECVELSRQAAKVWIKRKHYNAMGGASTVEWDPIAKAKSDAEDGVYEKWLTAVNFLESRSYDCGYIYDGLEDKSTTIERVLKSKYMKEDLGVVIRSDGTISFENGDNEKGAELLISLFDDMIQPSFKEPDVTNADLQREFIGRFKEKSTKTGVESSDATTNSSSSANKNETSSKGTTKKSSTKKKQRTKLAAKGLFIEHTPLNNFYVELSKLPVSTYEHCSAGMIRIFLEKMTVHFLIKKGSKHASGQNWDSFGIKLQEKVKGALSIIDPNKQDKQLKSAWELANGARDKLHNIDTLHRYIHDEENLPASSELITIWDRLHPFFLRMCEYMHEDEN